MRAAMAAAPLGDDVFGDDPSVNALQDKIAGLLGFEAALFVPTGTQSNLCAILSHCQRGDEYIVGQMQHCYRWEGGGGAVFGSVQPQPLEHQADGTLALADIEAAIKPDDPHFARSRLLALENTLGGKLLPFSYLEQATALAQRKGLARHLDGARLFNAAVAQAGADRFEMRWPKPAASRSSSIQRLGLLQQGAGRAGGLGAVRQQGLHRPRPPRAQDGRRRDAPGRDAGGCRFARAGPPCRAAGRRPRAGAAAGRRPGRHRRAAGRSAADQHPVRRPDGRGEGALGRIARRI